MKKLKQIKNIRIPEVRPARIFADRDRDGVANVFDCQPRNPRKQDSGFGDINKDLKAERKKQKKIESLKYLHELNKQTGGKMGY